MLKKKWIVKKDPDNEFYQKYSEINPIILKLLYTRGIKEPNEMELFLNPEYEQLNDPFLFKDMKMAVNRILEAIENKEKIIIHGDYDADGVTSSAVLYKTLQILGADVDVFIPHRENDGYGVNIINIKKFISKYQLLITVDCGITNIDEIKYAGVKGLDVIVTDHHEPLDELPAALAVINPKVKGETYPFKYLCGAGVAYKLACGIMQKQNVNADSLEYWGGSEGFCKWLLDLVAIGTVADVMPLVGENRIIVKYGMKVLAATRRPGLKKLAEVSNIDLASEDTYIIGFQIAPRLNAAGRLMHAEQSFKLLTTDDVSEATELAESLQNINSERQKVTDKARVLAEKQIEDQIENKLLFVYSEGIPGGVVGLIAGRLSDQYFRPALVVTKIGEQYVGSGRSIPSYDITQSLFGAETMLSRYGGHPQACGFTLKNKGSLDEFKLWMIDHANKNILDDDMVPVINVDGELKINSMDIDLIKKIEQLAPFGEGNNKPRFLLKNIFITAIDRLGSGEKHLRIMGKTEDSFVVQKFMFFGQGDIWSGIIDIGDTIDLVVEVGINVWNETESVQARVIDIKKTTND